MLQTFSELLNSTDKATTGGGYAGKIVSFAISTGFPNDGGTLTCLGTINDVLENPNNEFLLLFENFISLNETLSKERIGENLRSKTPKLIVLDDNKHNVPSAKELNTSSNTVFLFKPFTGGKFHHKLIIQFPLAGKPIVYTGSFHISTNAIQRNSESIVGLQSEELVDEHLSSLLLNSGLGEDSRVWDFLSRFDKRFHKIEVNQRYEVSRVFRTAQKILRKCQANMNRYADRLDRIEADLEATARFADEQIDIRKFFEHCGRRFKAGSGEEKLEAIKELKNNVFSRTLNQIYLKALHREWKKIKGKLEDIDPLPEYSKGHLNEWLEQLNTWLEQTKSEAKEEGVNIKENLKFINETYKALNDLNDYEYAFTRLSELEWRLDKFIMSL